MTTAPERISIKRRRVDEPVDHLFYQSKKQRTTNHLFVRVQDEGQKPAVSTTTTKATHQIPGIPLVRATQPGDETNDFRKYRAAHKKDDARLTIDGLFAHLDQAQPPHNSSSGLANTRRFHLTRDLSTALRPRSSGGIRKAKSYLRPHLPTFVERYETANARNASFHVKEPIDRVIRSIKSGYEVQPDRIATDDGNIEKRNVQTFYQIENGTRTGRSIHDDLATWDLDSDQLANELAELALEMDPEAKSASVADPQDTTEQISLVSSSKMHVAEPDDFVYETYIQIQQNAMRSIDVTGRSTFGYLVIDEEEEDLWEQYLRDEDENDEWDEEDEDSNAEENPRNEYPDEEVSSDDEYGRNIYKYRRDCSDDEQYDLYDQ